ncbi:MAG: hypothetical protein IVW57_07930 [Ktedonobacterales bacterium]|nr:hypothetical protein [Ktedonobacterales bacterium]
MSTPSVELTEGQRHSITALLIEVARAVARYEALARVTLAERPAYMARTDDLTPTEHREIEQLLIALVREANELAALCHVPTQTLSARATVGGEFTILWSDVVDTGPSRLEGYGPVPPATQTALAPHIQRLADLSLAVARYADSSSRQ